MILGSQLKNAILSGSNNISKYKKQINELNIFPVPDGDTGTNMSMTITAAAEAMEALEDAAPAGEVAKRAASAMLRGARGNSGVILSLLFRGISKGLEGKEEIDAPDLVAALERGVDEAYKAVMKPTEAPSSPWPGWPASAPGRPWSWAATPSRCGTPPAWAPPTLWRKPPSCCPC